MLLAYVLTPFVKDWHYFSTTKIITFLLIVHKYFVTMPTIQATHTAATLTFLNLHASSVQSGGQTVTVNISYSVP
jgi:hypothetical protein